MIALWFLRADVILTEPTAFNPQSTSYADAVERLETTSQMLVTITLATLGSAGLLLLRGGSLLLAGTALGLFACSTASLYYGTKLGYFAALTLASGRGEMAQLAPLFENQATGALLAGLALAIMVLIARATSHEVEK